MSTCFMHTEILADPQKVLLFFDAVTDCSRDEKMTQAKAVEDQIYAHLGLYVTGLHSITYIHRPGSEYSTQHLQHQRTNCVILEL